MALSFNATTLLNGNGINVQSVVNALLSQASAPLTNLQNQQTDLATQAGLLRGINNNLANLRATAVALANPEGPLASQSATSSQPGILTASAQTTATSGTHQIVVSNLATIGTIFTDPIANGDTSFLPIGETTGDIALQVGGGGGTSHDIAITQGGNDTLNTLASYINRQNWGVTASVVTDADGARLALYSQSTGAPGALAITNNTTTLAFNAPVGGINASLTIDGVPFHSASNTLAGAIAGVTLNLASAAPSTTVQVTVGPDTTQATNAINSFVSAYNAVIGGLNIQFSLGQTSNSEGPLGNDGALRALQSSLLRDVTYAVAGDGGPINLALLGIDMNNDGTLTVNQVATDTHPSLAQVLADNPAAVQTFFENASGTGFAQNFNNDLVNLTDSTEGIINVDLAGNATQQRALVDQITNLQDRLSAQQKQLTTLFAQVNATLQAYPTLLQLVTAELGALGGLVGSGSGSSGASSPILSANTQPATGTRLG